MVLAAVALLIARVRGRTIAALLGSRREALTGAAIGGSGALGAAAVSVVFLRVVAPLVTGAPVDYAPLDRIRADELLAHVVVLLPLGIVIPEELAFRGVLLAIALDEMPLVRAILLCAAAFALWHGSVIVRTVGETTLGPSSPWFTLACVAGLAVLFVGGAVFALLRLRTRTIASTVMAHWTFNAALLVGLWWSR